MISVLECKPAPTFVRWGSQSVPVLRRTWQRGPAEAYRKTYACKPGQSWWDAPSTSDQRQRYAIGPQGKSVPVEALIAADLEAEGAEHAALVELWAGSVVLVRSNLICIPTDGPLGWMIDRIRGANGGRLGGLPDVIATFSDGRVAFREAKSVSGKDRLRANQHAMADVLRGEFGRWAELAIVEWDL